MLSNVSTADLWTFGSVAIVALLYWRYQLSLSMVSSYPGLRTVVSPMSTLGLILPRIPFFSYWTYPGFTFPWDLKYKIFSDFKLDTISLIPYLPFPFRPAALLFTADPVLVSHISSASHRATFLKPIEQYENVLGYFGNNLVICEGESWKRQRRIGQPAFSRRMLEGLWCDMRNIFNEMVVAENWENRTPGKGEEIAVGHVVDLTLRMALAAIARAGFGMDFEWSAEAGDGFTAYCQAFGKPVRYRWWLHVLQACYDFGDYWPTWNPLTHAEISRFLPGALQWVVDEAWTIFERPREEEWSERREGMKVQEALHLVAKDSVIRLALPDWMMKIPIRRIRRMRLAFDTLEHELYVLAEERKQFHLQTPVEEEVLINEKPNRTDLLNNLVKAAMLDEGDADDLEKGRKVKKGLSDREIIGNTYIYFLAGHETTAHSLAWTLALLAAYPQHQATALAEIQSVLATNPIPTLDDYDKFPFVLACYLETLRLFPPVQQIPRVVMQDAAVPLPARGRTALDEKVEVREEVVVKKGSVVMLDIPGLHYNPRYWPDPEVFDPARFTTGAQDIYKDSYIPFGYGHRACLGRKFSEVESVSLLVHLLKDWEVLLPEDQRGDVEEARRRFSRAYVRITLTPLEVPLVFRRRKA